MPSSLSKELTGKLVQYWQTAVHVTMTIYICAVALVQYDTMSCSTEVVLSSPVTLDSRSGALFARSLTRHLFLPH